MPYRSDPSVSPWEALHELADHWQRLASAGEAPEYGFCGKRISELLAAGDPNNTYLPSRTELSALWRTKVEILLKAFDALAGDPREVHITRSGAHLDMWDLRETVRSLGRAIELLELVDDRRNESVCEGTRAGAADLKKQREFMEALRLLPPPGALTVEDKEAILRVARMLDDLGRRLLAQGYSVTMDEVLLRRPFAPAAVDAGDRQNDT